MRHSLQLVSFQNLRTDLTSVVAVACCAVLVNPMAFAAGSAKKTHASTKQEAVQTKYTADQRALHALNRFTFGPRPGDEARVREMGVDSWFEQQLNPDSINDAALDERLAEFPALKMSPQDMVKRYPNNNLIRRVAYKDDKGGAIPSLPHDAIERAIWNDQVAWFKLTRENKGEKKAEKAEAMMQSAQPDAKMSDNSMADTTQPQKTDQAVAAAGGNLERAAYEVIKPMPRNQVQEIVALDPDARFKKIMSLKPEEVFSLFKAARFNVPNAVNGAPSAERLIDGMSPLQKETLMSLQGSGRMLYNEVYQARILRDVYSERQLEAVMTDFWLNHFNVFIGKSQNEVYTLPSYERDVIRKHALGKFEDLLVATAQSPAMMIYLDNYLSIGPHSKAADRGKLYGAKNTGLNENYGRELMELHTLGVNGGYTQRDVTEVSKVLTGWTVDRGGQAGGRFEFNEQRHEPGQKLVLGKVIAEQGENEGRIVLHMLATSPATAQFVSRKLAVRFVSDNPPQSLINKMAKAFQDSDGDIKQVLRAMYYAPEFWSPEVYHAKLKTPIEYVISAVRVSGAQVDNALPLVNSLRTLGMPLYGMQTPNGWTWTQSQWLSTSALVNRMNFALILSTNRLPGTEIDWDHTLGHSAKQNGVRPVSLESGNPVLAEKEKALEHVVLGFSASEQTRNTVLSQQNDDAAQQAAKDFRLGQDSEAENMMNPGGKGEKKTGGALMQGRAAQALLAQRKPPTDPQAATMAGLLLGSPEFQRR